MVNPLDQVSKGAAHQPADQRHHGLEESEVKGQPESGAQVVSASAGADPEGNGKYVHGQANGDQERSDKFHVSLGVQKTTTTAVMVVSLILDPSEGWKQSQESEWVCPGLPGKERSDVRLEHRFRYVDSLDCLTQSATPQPS